MAGASHIVENNIYYGEEHDLSKLYNFHSPNFDDKSFQPSAICDGPEGELALYDFPKERIIRRVTPNLLGTYNGKKLYDIGELLTGRLTFDTLQDYRGDIEIQYADDIHDDMSLDFQNENEIFAFGDQIQTHLVHCDGKRHANIHTHFSWQTGRYFTLAGEAENLCFEVIHTDLEQTGFFSCDNDILNKLLDAYIRTQLANFHGCVPLDCPHRERMGYTGDGQITCETAMHVFDARMLYKKWMRDITDGQNILNGHIQHTAPFYGGAGGPATWGGAVIVLPYTYYKMYGDDTLVRENLSAMTFFLEYLESRCENALIVHEEDSGWFLGDWNYIGCELGELPRHLTAEYVNTIYLIKMYGQMIELAYELELDLDTTDYQTKRDIHVQAILDNFYDEKTGDFCQNEFAANAFAIDVALGDDRTLKHLAEKYDKLGGFDCGIFGTEILMRVLCENGFEYLAYKLLTSEKENHSFGYMLVRGATTIWETWNGIGSRCQPMFGACIKTLWTGFLGIKNRGAGYSRLLIEPCDIADLGNMKGSIMTANGIVSVDLIRNSENVKIKIDIPENTIADFRFRCRKEGLKTGLNIFEFNK